MSLVKQEVPMSAYSMTGAKASSKGTGKSAVIKAAEQLSTGRLAWIVVKRHKLAILATGNVILVLNTIAPYWWDLVTGVVKSLVR